MVIWMEALNLAAGVVGVVRRPRSSPLNCSCLIFDPLIVKVIQFPDEEQNGIMHLIYLPRTSRANDGSLKYFLLSPAGLVDHLQSLDCKGRHLYAEQTVYTRSLEQVTEEFGYTYSGLFI